MRKSSAFTLVEVLIVVIILGILAAIVVPQFATATADSQRVAVADQVSKLRRIIAVYYVRNGNTWPDVQPGDGTWGGLIPTGSNVRAADYMRNPPRNQWVGGPNAGVIVYGTGPDAAYQTTHGWIYDPSTGNVWAGGCDGSDNPLPRP